MVSFNLFSASFKVDLKEKQSPPLASALEPSVKDSDLVLLHLSDFSSLNISERSADPKENIFTVRVYDYVIKPNKNTIEKKKIFMTKRI